VRKGKEIAFFSEYVTIEYTQECEFVNRQFLSADKHLVLKWERLRRVLVKVLSETGEDVADFFGFAKVGQGVGDGIVVAEAE
jgi:hypothetical protein